MNANFIHIFVRGFLVALIVAFAASATAQEKSSGELAQEHFNAGAKAYLAEDYSEAVVQFLTAYEYQENPMILYNLSLAYQGLGDFEKAITAAERAASGELPEKAVPRNAARIDALETRIHATEVAGEIARAKQSAVARVEADADDSVAKGSTSGTQSSVGTIGWIGAGSMAVGAGLLAYALVLELTLSNEIEQFERTPSVRQRDSLAEDQRTGKIVLFTGSGLFATGLALFLYDYLTGSEPPVAASIAPNEGGAVLQIGGRF